VFCVAQSYIWLPLFIIHCQKPLREGEAEKEREKEREDKKSSTSLLISASLWSISRTQVLKEGRDSGCLQSCWKLESNRFMNVLRCAINFLGKICYKQVSSALHYHITSPNDFFLFLRSLHPAKVKEPKPTDQGNKYRKQ